jgi:hypothetical protein
MTYLLTFTCYGTHLHGAAAGSVDRFHNAPGNRAVDDDPRRVGLELERMGQPPYCMDEGRRRVVLAGIQERCRQRNWFLRAAHVRTNHVHLVVDAEAKPERVMNDLKSYASRRLNLEPLDKPARKRWTRHGSTRWLWTPESVTAAIVYVVGGQGEPMASLKAVGA